MKHARSGRARSTAESGPAIDRFRAQHMSVVDVAGAGIGAGAKFDESESPLIWLARRKGTDGRALIEPHQLQAGERLRADFTQAQMMPRTTTNWHCALAGRSRGSIGGPHHRARWSTRSSVLGMLWTMSDRNSAGLSARCLLLSETARRLVERERQWPARSAKVVLQLALERLARHYGYRARDAGQDGKARSGPGRRMASAIRRQPKA